ncbi:MAG TPA: hypothetical protein VKP60_12595 [Magnetospirillaceae bacterium]|nr:hypothetical protein [Magnetospirillaceae bacterium]
MKIGSTNDLSSQLQALENAALGQYQSSQNFNFLLQQTGQTGQADSSSASSSSSSSTSSQSSSASGYQLAGSFTGGSIYAVGTFGANGQLNYFSPQQIQSEQNAIATVRQSSYADALQNFMTLSQAGGQIGGGSYNDQVSFTADNGLVGGNFDTSLTLKPVGGGVPGAAS